MLGRGLYSLSWNNSKVLPGTRILPEFEANDVKRISLKNKISELELSCDNGVWGVENKKYPADFSQITSFVRDLAELKAAYGIPADKTLLDRFGLDSKKNSPTLVTLYDGQNKKLGTLLVGNMHFLKSEVYNPYAQPIANGRYVMLPDETQPVLVADTMKSASPFAYIWLKKDFLRPFPIMSIKLKGKRGKWLLSREKFDGKFILSGIKGKDQTNEKKVKQLMALLSQIVFIDVADKTSKSLVFSDLITIKTLDDFIYKFYFGKDKKTQRYFLKVEVSCDKLSGNLNKKLKQELFFTKYIYEVPAQLVQGILLKRDDLLEKDQPKKVKAGK
jgi:hypothetical protein